MASSYGLTPDEWQFSVLEAWLGETKAHKWAAGRCGTAVPRQNGKNALIEIRELYGIVALGEKFLHTAHEVKTARKAFLRLASFFENERRYPELAALAKEIRKTNGQEAIVLQNGGSVEFVARSRGSGRGYTVDVLVMDEAQEMTDEQLEALLPTISSAPLKNPQQIYTGTPPGPGSPGEVFTRTREAGIAGKDKRLAWHEWSVDGKVDIRNRDLWAATNPSLGSRLNLSVIEDELASMSPEGFARERLGQWSSQAIHQVIPQDEWDAIALPKDAVPTDGHVAFAIDMSPDRSRVSIGACRRPVEGPPHFEMVSRDNTGKGLGPVVDWIVERWPKSIAVVIDGNSPAMSLVPELNKRHVKVTVTGAADMGKACGMFADAIRDGEVTRFDQAPVNDALVAAKKRDIGYAGAWGWDRRKPEVDLTPLVAVTLAYFGAMTSKRRPGRKGRVMV